jgi:adhesin transport system membrane fusion protein
MNIDDTKFASEFGEIRERRAAMAARVARLQAEATGKERPAFSEELRQAASRAVETEGSVFETRARKIAQDIDVIAQQETRLTESLKLLDREIEITRRLHAQKVVPEIEMLRLERQASEMRGQLAEAKSRLVNIRTAFRSKADEVGKVERRPCGSG